MKALQLFVPLLACSLILACQKKKENTDPQQTANFIVARGMFFSNLVPPGEAAAQLQATAAEFDAKLMNDPKIFSQYAANPVKAAANLGIYLSDLNYSIAYTQQATTKEYFDASYELSKAAGIEQRILGFLKVRYYKNLAKNDSAKAIVEDLFEKSTRDLQGTERERIAGIAIAAYQIENLHIALGILESYPKDLLPADARTAILVPLFKLMLKQQDNVENIYNFLKSYSDPLDPDKNPNYPYYANAFEELIAVYKKLDVDTKIANNQGVDIMNDAVVKELSEKVNAIRNKIVSVE